MKRLKEIINMLKPARKCTGDLSDAILQIYKDAGAILHSDFHGFPIMADWRCRIDPSPENTKHLFFTQRSHRTKIEELLTNLYREPSVADEQGALFIAPHEPRAPMALVGSINQDTIFVQVVVKETDK